MFKENYCVVGNAPSEVGKGAGEIIDACEQIFRFNNFVTSDDYQNDYGLSTTHWVTTFARDIKPKIQPYQVVCPLPLNIPKYLKRYSFTNVDTLRGHLGTAVFIPSEYFEELLTIIPNPSTGISLLFWMWKELCTLDEDRVKGFTFFDKSQKHHYFDEHKACMHKGDLEKALYHKMINGYTTKIL
jgi:hypothetical protein